MEGKIKAAVDIRQDHNLAIIARTDARAILGLDEAIERGKSYAETGADIIFVEAPESVEEMERIVKEINAPVMVNMIKGSRTPLLSAKELDRMGVKIAIFPNECQRAAIWAVQSCANHLRKKGGTLDFEFMVDFSSREEIVGTAQWETLGSRYSSSRGKNRTEER